MNSKQRGVLADIFAKPAKKNIRWAEVEKLFVALGADVRQGRGSRVRITLNGQQATFHTPHPSPEVRVKTLADIRDFLILAGVQPQAEEKKKEK